MKTTFTLNEVERMGWLPPGKAKDLERYRAALEQIGGPRDQTGTAVQIRAFARDVLAVETAR